MLILVEEKNLTKWTVDLGSFMNLFEILHKGSHLILFSNSISINALLNTSNSYPILLIFFKESETWKIPLEILLVGTETKKGN